MAIHKLMEYGIVQIINLHGPRRSDYLKAGSLEQAKTKDPKTEDLISESADQTQNTTALHSVFTIKHKNRNCYCHEKTSYVSNYAFLTLLHE